MIGILPLSPNKPSVLVPIIFSKCLSEIHGTHVVFTVNSYGLKGGFKGSLLEEELGFWNVKFDTLIYDHEVYVNLLENINEGALKVYEEEIITCTCGRLELPVSVSRNKQKNGFKLLTDDICNICQTSRKKYVKSLGYKLSKQGTEHINIYPQNVQSQYLKFKSTLDDKYLKISKNRKTDFQYKWKNHTYNIDIDFLNMLYFNYLCERGIRSYVLARKIVYFLAKSSFLLKANADTLLLTYQQNLNELYPLIKKSFTSYWHFFLLIVINNSWKKNSAVIDPRDIEKVMEIDPDIIKSFFLNSMEKKDADYSKLNRNILNNI